MPWVKLDEHFYDHPRWATAQGDSIALWVCAIAWCNRNDSVTGFIPRAKTRGLCDVRSLTKTLADLVARGAFEEADGGYLIHDYTEYQDNAKVQAIREKRRAAGKRGAEARWGSKDDKADADGTPDAIANEMANAIANGMATKCPETETGITYGNTASDGKPKPDPFDGFDAFWEQYPRKENKKTARRRWKNLTKTDRTRALAALPRHVEFWRGSNTEPRFIPYPSTWLNGEHWNNELDGTAERIVEVDGAQIARGAM